MTAKKDPRDDYTRDQVAEATGVDVSDIRSELGICTIDGMTWWQWLDIVNEGDKL